MNRLAASYRRSLFAPNIHWRDEDEAPLADLCEMPVIEVSRVIAERPFRAAAATLPNMAALSRSKSDGGVYTYTFHVSSATPDRMDDVIDQAGIDLRHYKQNPVVLFQHDTSKVVGKALSIAVIDGKLTSTMKFNPQSGFARNVEAAVRGGYLKATSVGFSPLQWTPRPGGPGLKFERIELLEYSVVSVPANPEALIVSMNDSAGRSVMAERAKRQREVELAQLRHAPAPPPCKPSKADRAREVASIKSRTR